MPFWIMRAWVSFWMLCFQGLSSLRCLPLAASSWEPEFQQYHTGNEGFNSSRETQLLRRSYPLWWGSIKATKAPCNHVHTLGIEPSGKSRNRFSGLDLGHRAVIIFFFLKNLLTRASSQLQIRSFLMPNIWGGSDNTEKKKRIPQRLGRNSGAQAE